MTAKQNELSDALDWLSKIAAQRDRLLRCAADPDVLGDRAASKAIFTQAAASLNELCGSLRLELKKTYPLSHLIALCKGVPLTNPSISAQKQYFDDLFQIPDEIYQYALSISGSESNSLSPHAREEILLAFFERDAVDLLLRKSANASYLCEIISSCQGPPQSEPQNLRVVEHAIRRLRESWQRSSYWNMIMARPVEQLSDIEKVIAVLNGWYLLKDQTSMYDKRQTTTTDYGLVRNPIIG